MPGFCRRQSFDLAVALFSNEYHWQPHHAAAFSLLSYVTSLAIGWATTDESIIKHQPVRSQYWRNRIRRKWRRILSIWQIAHRRSVACASTIWRDNEYGAINIIKGYRDCRFFSSCWMPIWPVPMIFCVIFSITGHYLIFGIFFFAVDALPIPRNLLIGAAATPVIWLVNEGHFNSSGHVIKVV